MSVFLTDVNSKKQVPKTLIRNAIREDDPEKLKEALIQYKSGTDFDPNELVHIFYRMNHCYFALNQKSIN